MTRNRLKEMATLKQAREQGKLDQFAKDHDADAPGLGDPVFLGQCLQDACPDAPALQRFQRL